VTLEQYKDLEKQALKLNEEKEIEKLIENEELEIKQKK